MLFTFIQLVYSVLLYVFFIITLPYFVVKVLTTKKYRSGIWRRLGFLSKESKEAFALGNTIWVHAVSVGEVQAALPLIERLKTVYPEKRFMLSVTTLTGNTVASKATAGDPRVTVMYFPIDFWHIFNHIFRSYSIDLIILIETELWPNLLMEAYVYRVPVIMANGRISAGSLRGYYPIRLFLRQCMRSIAWFCMQNDESAQRLRRLGIDDECITVCGNIKYEALLTLPVDRNIGSQLMRNASWSDNDLFWVVGSTHQGEEDMIASAYCELIRTVPNLKLLIAPRHPERLDEAETILKSHGIKLYRKTALDSCLSPVQDCRVVLLDTMGELRHLYDIATVAFVGKSMVSPGGGQNLLEPASLAKPVVFGQYMSNFTDITDKFISAQAGVMVHTQQELVEQTRRILTDTAYRCQLGERAKKEVQRWQGATDCILSCITDILPVNA